MIYVIKKMRFTKDKWRCIQEAAKDALITRREFLKDDEKIENINIGNVVEDGANYEFTQVFKIKDDDDYDFVIGNTHEIMAYYQLKCPGVVTSVYKTEDIAKAKAALGTLKQNLTDGYEEVKPK